MSVRVFAPAKINLTLKVGRPRADGLHPLQSVVVFADVGDVIEASSAEGLLLAIAGEFAGQLESDESNLVLRAARGLAQAAGLATPGAALVLEKNLPVASGIGGGSADAAATLRALDALWGLNLGVERLSDIGRKLGADVPVCVGGVSAYVTGAGENVQPIAAPALAAVLVNPLAPVATADVYRRFDELKLGVDLSDAPAPAWSNRAEALAAIATLGNDLEAPARALAPAIEEVKAVLNADARVDYAALSGSGATVFALVADMESAAALADNVQSAHPDWWVCDAMLGA